MTAQGGPVGGQGSSTFDRLDREMRSPAGPAMARRLNRGMVIELLSQYRQLSRTDLRVLTGLARPSVSAILNDLLADGIIRAAGLASRSADSGRPPQLFEINPDHCMYLGVHVSTEHIALSLTDAVGTTLRTGKLPSPTGGGDVAATVTGGVLRWLKSTGRSEGLVAVGLGVAGMVDQSTGWVIFAPTLDWRDVPLQSALERSLAAGVRVINEAHAAALAEAEEGAAVGASDFAWVTLGVGVGSGLMVAGHLVEGTRGVAGEIGHCRVTERPITCHCGRQGCLETIASTSALAARLRQLGAKHDDDADAAVLAGGLERAKTGEQRVVAVFDEAARALALALSYVGNVVGTPLIVLGGPFGSHNEWFAERVQEVLREYRVDQIRLRVVASSIEAAEVRGPVLLARRLRPIGSGPTIGSDAHRAPLPAGQPSSRQGGN